MINRSSMATSKPQDVSYYFHKQIPKNNNAYEIQVRRTHQKLAIIRKIMATSKIEIQTL
uniref:Uncharacterized protein n=1 Tax=Arundo donax TaxID=35708 RepID=A0A0A8ZYY1_ARUDO